MKFQAPTSSVCAVICAKELEIAALALLARSDG
jgi:hypothetical protein